MKKQIVIPFLLSLTLLPLILTACQGADPKFVGSYQAVLPSATTDGRYRWQVEQVTAARAQVRHRDASGCSVRQCGHRQDEAAGTTSGWSKMDTSGRSSSISLAKHGMKRKSLRGRRR